MINAKDGMMKMLKLFGDGKDEIID